MKLLASILIVIWISSPLNADTEAGIEFYNNENYAVAISEFLTEANKGEDIAQYYLGKIYARGEGVNIDFEEAMKWFRLAADQGNSAAQRSVGIFYDNGDGVVQDFGQAMQWYHLAADQEDPVAQRLIGQLYHLGDGVKQDPVEAMNWYRLAADQGNSEAQRSIGDLYYDGGGVDIDFKEAMNWYRLAAEKGNPHAQRNIGYLYDFGQGVDADFGEAMKWYRLAADQKDPGAQRLIGQLYYYGDGVKQDYVEAMHWYRLSADQGDAEAQSTIGNLYYYGGGIDVDYTEAIKWYRMAANQGDLNSLIEIASIGYTLGDWGQAIQKLEELLKSVQMIENGTLDNRIDALHLLSMLYADTGQNKKSSEVYEAILSILNKNDLPNAVGHRYRATLNLAIQQIKLTQFSEANQNLQFVEKMVEENYGKNTWDYGNLLGNFGYLFSVQSDYYSLKSNLNTAIKYSLEALKVLQGCCPESGRIGLYFGNLAEYYQGLGNYAEAEAYFLKALSIRDTTIGREHLDNTDLFANMAKLYLIMERYDDAYKFADLAFKNYLLLKKQVSSNDQKLFYNSDEDVLFLYLASKQQSNKNAGFSDNFQIAQLAGDDEITKFFNYNSFMASDESIKTKQIFSLYKDRVNELKSLEYTISKLLLSSTNLDQELVTEKVSYQASLKTEIDIIHENLSTESKLFRELHDIKTLSLSSAQDLINPKEALILFHTSHSLDYGYAFIVTKNNFQSYKVDLSEPEISKIIRKLRVEVDLSNVLGVGSLPNFDTNLAYELYQKLFGPIEDMLQGVEHLLVVPSGAMESLPLNLLVTEKPFIDEKKSVFEHYQTAAWLPKRYSLTRLPSVSSLRALRMHKIENRAKRPFIGFGDPVLDGEPGEIRGLKILEIYQGAQADIQKVRQLPELPETSDELRLIARHLNSSEADLYLRERATETKLKSIDLSTSRILGFATHGLVAGELSGLAEPALVLTPPKNGSELDDGLLKSSEVSQLKLNADIVLLSACNTASGAQLGAQGLSGLARAFIYAGARSLLVSHWSVDSDAAAILTTEMFKALESNPRMGRSNALQKSMISLIFHDENIHYSHPAFWAPFSLIGEGAAIN